MIKKILIAILIFYSCAQKKNKKPEMLIQNPVINMGDIKFDSTYKLQYNIYNHGSVNILIDTVTTSCGCSVPKVSSKIIRPSDSAYLFVDFKPVEVGDFKKSIVIKSNIDSSFSIVSFNGRAVK